MDVVAVKDASSDLINHMNILALDVGKFNSAACFFDSATRNLRFVTVATQPNFLSTTILLVVNQLQYRRVWYFRRNSTCVPVIDSTATEIVGELDTKRNFHLASPLVVSVTIKSPSGAICQNSEPTTGLVEYWFGPITHRTIPLD